MRRWSLGSVPRRRRCDVVIRSLGSNVRVFLARVVVPGSRVVVEGRGGLLLVQGQLVVDASAVGGCFVDVFVRVNGVDDLTSRTRWSLDTAALVVVSLLRAVVVPDGAVIEVAVENTFGSGFMQLLSVGSQIVYSGVV